MRIEARDGGNAAVDSAPRLRELDLVRFLAAVVVVALASAHLVHRLVERPGGRLLARRLKAAAARIREASGPVPGDGPGSASGGPAAVAARDHLRPDMAGSGHQG